MSHHNRKERFKIIQKNCGHGGSGKISIVKRKSDGKLLVWKRPTSKFKHQKYQKEIGKIKLWRKLGITSVKVCWHPDNKSLLKTYIKGPTLKQMLKKNPKLFSEKENGARNALIDFVKLLIDSKYYIHDLKGANLIYDGDKWQVIDSGPADRKNTRRSVRKEYKKNLYEKWSRGIRSREGTRYLKSFLKEYCR